MVCQAVPGVDAGMCRVYRGRPGSTGTCREEILKFLNMFKITGLYPGSAVQAPCWRRDLPCLRRVTVLTPGCTVSLSLPLYRFSAGVYRVGCGLGHGLGRDNHLLARHLLLFSSFRLFLWIFVDVDASVIKLIMI